MTIQFNDETFRDDYTLPQLGMAIRRFSLPRSTKTATCYSVKHGTPPGRAGRGRSMQSGLTWTSTISSEMRDRDDRLC